MTSIDTSTLPKECWKSGSEYLKAIQFCMLSDDEKNISLTTDEEGNNEIILDKDTALWLSEELKKLVGLL